jgi:hypothetical protein
MLGPEETGRVLGEKPRARRDLKRRSLMLVAEKAMTD